MVNTAYRTLKDPIQRAEYLIRLEAGAVKEIRTSPPADLFDEILELQEDLDEFRELSPETDANKTTQLREKLQSARETLEQRQAQMETSLLEKFKFWDALQTKAPAPTDLREQKDSVLGDMQEILSNRTYVRNIVNDLVETTG